MKIYIQIGLLAVLLLEASARLSLYSNPMELAQEEKLFIHQAAQIRDLAIEAGWTKDSDSMLVQSEEEAQEML